MTHAFLVQYIMISIFLQEVVFWYTLFLICIFAVFAACFDSCHEKSPVFLVYEQGYTQTCLLNYND